MKAIEIKEIVDNYFSNIEKSFYKILIQFDKDDIEQFRTDIKKLRSIFHLLDMESGGFSNYKITAKMKTFYGYAGIIHNLQSLLKSINIFFQYSTDGNVFVLKNKLQKEISYWKKNTTAYVDLHKNFHMDEENILIRLPDRLRSQSIKKFTSYVGFEIQTHLTRFDDDRLNNIRKLLEDLLYNWEYIKPYANTLPDGLQTESEINYLVESLLDYRDKYAINTILDAYYNHPENEDEKSILASIMRFCKSQKEYLKKLNCSILELLPVQPIVKKAFSF